MVDFIILCKVAITLKREAVFAMAGSAAGVVVSAFGCVVFCVLYVFIIQPTIFHIFGLQQPDMGRVS